MKPTTELQHKARKENWALYCIYGMKAVLATLTPVLKVKTYRMVSAALEEAAAEIKANQGKRMVRTPADFPFPFKEWK